MSDKDIGALPVRDPAKKVVGIISERDYARKVVLTGKTSRETPVQAIMTPASQMISIQADTTLDACMALMTIHHIRHLPVFSGERLIGMISSRDIVKAAIAEKSGQIDNLIDISDAVFTQSFDDDIAGGKG